MPLLFFSAENFEELVSISNLGLRGLDHLMSALPPGEAVPSDEMGALVRLLSSTLSLGLGFARDANGQSDPG